MAIESFAKPFNDINLVESFEMESTTPDEVDIGKGKGTSSTSMLSGRRSHRKRGYEIEESITSILDMKVREVAKSTHALTKNEVDIDELYDVVMKITDFNDGILNNMFDYLERE
ncbi:unnamed protein product [Dovyalis caffra]|uniref:Uncharacterized protein n=1 Tax=Dovyalis caffra TaxID=77055 RepID=A0AAV1R096_9ROSI|nr:unnamed protein product [Dovyalis caffra]